MTPKDLVNPHAAMPRNKPHTNPPTSMRRVILAAGIGTFVEYFDFAIYAIYAGLLFGPLFFPSGDEFVSTMLAFSTFAVGYLSRPIGGILFGHFGDKIGRRRVMFITLTMMGVATAIIGLLPTYSQIGIAAPSILILMRIIQGVGVGGEYGGAMLLVIEHGRKSGRQGLYTALVGACSSFGFLVATGFMAAIFALTSDEQLAGWAWRIPFLMGAVLLVVGVYIRRHLGETPAMEDALQKKETVKVPLFELFRTHRRQLLVSLGAPVALAVCYPIILAFSVPYAIREGQADQAFLLGMLTFAQAFYIVAVILGGHLSDRIERGKVIMAGAVGLGIWFFAFFPLLLSGTTINVVAALAVALLFLGAVYGPLAVYLAELFSTTVRYSGLSFGYQITVAIGGGLSPLVATALAYSTGSWVPVAAVVACACLVTFATILSNRRNRESSDATDMTNAGV